MRTHAQQHLQKGLVLWRRPCGQLLWDPPKTNERYGCEDLERVPPIAVAWYVWAEILMGKVCIEDQYHRPHVRRQKRNWRQAA